MKENKEQGKILKSISGVRGTYGSDGLSEEIVVKYVTCYLKFLRETVNQTKRRPLGSIIQNLHLGGKSENNQDREPADRDNELTIIVGRDGRSSGAAIKDIIIHTLLTHGAKVIDTDIATTPGLSYNIISKQYSGGIMVTASHNPQEWNGLKLMNQDGENLNSEEWELLNQHLKEYEDHSSHLKEERRPETIKLFDEKSVKSNEKELLIQDDLYIIKDEGAQMANLRHSSVNRDDHLDHYKDHIKAIISLPIIDIEQIKKRRFKVAVDTCNSSASIGVMLLANYLDLEVEYIHSNITGSFDRNPEPNDHIIADISLRQKEKKTDIGFAFDPDVDRLLVLDENGQSWGEEYSLLASADYVLSLFPGTVVSNMSSSIVIQEIADTYGSQYYSSPVGEAHVVKEMKRAKAVIGGEGNGGIIYPQLSYCRDALLGMTIILSSLASKSISASQLRSSLPPSYMNKKKYNLKDSQWTNLVRCMKENYSEYPIDERDGIKVNVKDGWFHLRKSNTEPVVRLILEAHSKPSLETMNREIEKYLLSLK